MVMTLTKTYACDEIVEALCRDIFSKFADPKQASPHANKWGVEVFYSNKNPGHVRFVFRTKDLLEVDYLFEMQRLRAEGREYIEKIVEILFTQIDAARAERQREDSIMLFPAKTNVASNTVKAAVKAAANEGA